MVVRTFHQYFPWMTILLLAGSVSAEKTLLTPQHIAKLRNATSAAISPDGKLIAYTLSVPRDPAKDDNGTAHTELHVVDANGKSRPFVTGEVSVREIQWTPDGQKIAFVAKRGKDEHTSLYLIAVDGGEAQNVLSVESDLHGVSFAPDGQRVAFLAEVPRSKEQQADRDRGFNQRIYEEDWQPTRVWTARLGAAVEEPSSYTLAGSASAVHWSPAGRALAVALAPTPLVDDGYMFRRLAIVDADTGRVTQQIQNPGKLGQFAWSPDGQQLALISGQDIHDPSDGRLMVASIPGDGTVRDLMPAYEAHVASIAWQDATTIRWLAAEGTQSTFGSVTLDGKQMVQVQGPGPIFSSFSLSENGKYAALVGDSADHPREVFRLPVAGDGEVKRLTDSNPWLAKMRFAKQSVVRWKARDGVSLEGILVHPVNYQAGQRYPLIMLVHGGPESHVSNGWVTFYSRPGQVGAARGFAVFYPNYRGSTGRGVEFSKLGQADAAGREFDDLVDGVDHLVQQGLVDKSRVGITGGSYGGYASAWGATYYSDRFAASAMFVGISDNVSKVGTTDIPEEMYLVHHRKRLWEDWDYFLNRSPIRYVERNQTPTLILHGEDDPRVHPSQSLELFRHLKTLKQAPVRLVLYPGEGHGNRKAAAKLDYNLRVLRWMEHYLQGPGGEAPPYELQYTVSDN